MMFQHGRKVMQLIKSRTRHSTRVQLALLLIVVVIITAASNISNLSSIGSKPEVENKIDLLTVDSSKRIRAQRDPYLDTKLASKHFIKEKVLGFISNLDLKKHRKKHGYDGQDGNSKFTVVDTYENLVTCEDLKYEHDLSFHVTDHRLNTNLIESRREILSWNNQYSKRVKDKNLEKGLSELQIVEKFWFEYGHSSIWLESHQCYLTYSVVTYTKSSVSFPDVSLIKATAYDKDWKEIRGKRITFNDVKIPNNIEQELKELDKQLGVVDCKKITEIDHRQKCEVEQNKQKLKIMKEKENILDHFSMKYPRVIDIEAKLIDKFGGVKDPHVILKQNPQTGIEEPVIIFNMDEGSGKRLYSFLPHRKVQSLTKFSMFNIDDLSNFQTNWSPFFTPEDESDYSSLSLGNIHFVENISPIHIIRCSLDDGICDTVFKGEDNKYAKNEKIGKISGGTQYVPLPDSLPSVKGKNIWVGFAKTQYEGCGCGPAFFRPVLTVLIEVDGVYHFELISPGLDFTISPLNFKLTSTSCDSENVLIPKSIVSWYISSQDTSKHSYKDYMTVTVNEAHSLTKTVIINGVLDYILNIYQDKDIRDTFVLNEEANSIVGATRFCVADYSFEVCRRYGLKHPANEKGQSKPQPN